MFPRNFEKHLKSDLKKRKEGRTKTCTKSCMATELCVWDTSDQAVFPTFRQVNDRHQKLFFFVSGFIVATFCALLLNISLSVQQGCNATVENECPSARFDPTPKQSIVARALNIWIVVSHIIISSAGYKGNMTELQETNKLNNNNNNNDKPQS